MTTEAEAIKDVIYNNWGSGGYSGSFVKSTDNIYNTESKKVHAWPSTDYIAVLHDTMSADDERVNDNFEDQIYHIDIKVSSSTSAQEAKDLLDEVKYLLNNTAISGFSSAWVIRRDWSQSMMHNKVYIIIATFRMVVNTTSSNTAPSAGTTGDFAIGGDLTVGGGDVTLTGTSSISSDGPISVKPNGDTDDYLDFKTTSGETIIKRIGGNKVIIESDDATYVVLTVKEDTAKELQVRWKKDTDVAQIFTNAELQIIVNSDATDYWFFSTGSNIASLLPVEDKVHCIGSATLSADHMYSDDFDNTSPFEKFDRPVDELKKIKDKDGRLDYASMPEFVRTHIRDPAKNKTEEYEDEHGNIQHRVIERAPKDVIANEGWSVNRMVILLYQAVQELTDRLEKLEVK